MREVNAEQCGEHDHTERRTNRSHEGPEHEARTADKLEQRRQPRHPVEAGMPIEVRIAAKRSGPRASFA
jgi:hypothetical protein